MELDTADHRRSSGVTSGLHRMLTRKLQTFMRRLSLIALSEPLFEHPAIIRMEKSATFWWSNLRLPVSLASD